MVIVDFGIALDRREVLQHAVREGARSGAIGANTSTIAEHTSAQSRGVLSDADVSVCYVDENNNGNPGNAGDSVQVRGDYNYQFTLGGGEMLGLFSVPVPTIAMTPSAKSRLETSVAGAVACSP
jgi:Flp pilus assembly protein TadG